MRRPGVTFLIPSVCLHVRPMGAHPTCRRVVNKTRLTGGGPPHGKYQTVLLTTVAEPVELDAILAGCRAPVRPLARVGAALARARAAGLAGPGRLLDALPVERRQDCACPSSSQNKRLGGKCPEWVLAFIISPAHLHVRCTCGHSVRAGERVESTLAHTGVRLNGDGACTYRCCRG